jgi:ribose 5-phosphate isomerase B
MAAKKVYTGSDHAGFELRGRVVAHLRALGFDVDDVGSPTAESTDYPDWAAAVGRAVRDHAGSVGVLVCGTGLGVCMTANKIHGVRAADAWLDTEFEGGRHARRVDKITAIELQEAETAKQRMK